MVVTQAATRKVIRQTVGRNTHAMKNITAATGGSTTTFLTDDLPGTTADIYKTQRWLGTDSPNDGVDARVTGSAVSSNRTTLTIFPAVTSTLTADTAELWSKYDPEDINDFIQQAHREATAHIYDTEESLALHGDSRQSRFDIETKFAMLNRIDFRTSVDGETIEDATDAWTELVDGEVTASQDSEDTKRGSSLKLVVTAAAEANDILATEKIDSKDISGKDTVEFWIKSTVTVAANDLQLLLDDTASCASPIESLNIPALVADTWTFVRLPMATPELDTAIISVGLKYVTDLGACTIWLSDIQGVLNDSASWATLPKHLWSIDKQARDLVLKRDGRSMVGYRLMKLIGGDKPLLLASDTDVCEINDWYVICRATALTFASSPLEEDNAQVGYWELLAQQAKGTHHLPANIRTIS